MRYIALMNNIKIHTIDLNFLGHANGIAAFLIESPAGPILIETGPHSTLTTLEENIFALGYNPSDIKHVFITHIHLDHAGAAWHFASLGAQIYLHPRGYKHMHDPSRLLASAKMIYKENMDRLWGTLNPIDPSKLTIVEHLEEISLDGITMKAHHTPGHAQHHIAWQTDDVLFTGDVAGVSINHGPVIPPCPPPDINRESWLLSIDHLLSLEDVTDYYLTHFGKITAIKEHMTQLKESIDSYTNFMKPYAVKNMMIEEVLPAFQDFVMEYLTSHGLKEDDANAYEAANPSDMSATGLLRYWKKKLSPI